jgi:PAS domain S-box-containing protein
MNKTIQRYGLAIFLTTAAIVATSWSEVLRETPFFLFLAAVSVSALGGGVGPGVLTALLSITAISYFFLPPIHSLYVATAGDVLRLALFALVAALISWLTGRVRESEERFRFFVESVKDYCFFQLNPHGVIVEWNMGAERLLGYSAQEIIRRPLSALCIQDAFLQGKCERELRVAKDTGLSVFTANCLRKNGSTFQGQLILKSLLTAHNKVRGYSVVLQDMTEPTEHLRERASLVNQLVYKL